MGTKCPKCCGGVKWVDWSVDEDGFDIDIFECVKCGVKTIDWRLKESNECPKRGE